MNLASAQQVHDAVADLFQAQRLLDHAAMVASHGDHILIAEKIGRVQHVDVQGVTFDPLAAVEETAQQADCGIDADSQRPLDGVHGAHLVGDGADAADARRDVRQLRRSGGRAGRPQRSAAARRS